VKQSLAPINTDWSDIRVLTKEPLPDLDYHDREPAALLDDDGNIELFWSSNRSGSWSIWHNTLDIGTGDWEAAEPVTQGPYSERNSLPFKVGVRTLLFYRSNRGLSYASKVYGATETVDLRYSGSTTIHVRDTEKIALSGKFEDFKTYTYDTGNDGRRTNKNRYARDTIGLYLTPDTKDPQKISSGIKRIENVLDEFMPLTDRAVFITGG